MDISAFERLLEDSLDDLRMSRSERGDLRAWLKDQNCSGHILAQLRNTTFRIVREHAHSEDPQQLFSWLESVMRTLYPVDAVEAVQTEVWFSPDQDCVGRICRLIQQTRKSIDVCVFTVTDNRLSDSLLDAHRRGVSVRLITDNEKSSDSGSDVEGLDHAGIAVRMDLSEWHMHHKFAVFDGSILLNGSYNWTRGAAEHNAENFLITDQAPLVHRYQQYFAELWLKLQP